MTLLQRYSMEIEQFINTIKPLIEFDFSIVDENCKRIIGTGHYEHYIGLTLPKGTATHHVLQTGTPIVRARDYEIKCSRHRSARAKRTFNDEG